MSASTRMYRVLGGRRPIPAPAPATTVRGHGRHAEHLVIERPGTPGRTPELVEGSIVASVNIKPLEDKILVQANEAETTTASGLVIPDTAKEKPQEGTVGPRRAGRRQQVSTRVPPRESPSRG